MRKSIKNLSMTVLILLATLLFSTVAYAAEIPAATDEFYVNDFADVFTAEEEERLLDNAVTLAEESDGIQVVVTTVESLDGDSVENYAVEMYNQYEIGKDDMGLLILLSTGDRQIRVEVGRAMEAYINDSKAGRFMDEYAIPYLSENKFNEGLINLQEALIDEIVATVEAESESAQTTQDSESASSAIGDIFGGILIAIVLIVIVLAVITLVKKIIAKSKKKQQEIDSLRHQLENTKSDFKQETNNLKGVINSLLAEKGTLKTAYDTLKNKYATLNDRYERVKILYPEADQKVSDMIKEEIRQKNMALAKKVDEIIGRVINLQASKDIVQDVKIALDSYSRLTKEQRAFVESDISRLKKLYDESVELKKEYDRIQEEKRRKKAAADALSSINSVIAGITIGKSMHLRKLKDAMAIYNNLDAGSKEFFDKSALDRLNKLYGDAKRDKEEEEEERRRREEEERRRRMSSSSNSSFGGGSHFGGFGGSSGGGGASRGF